MSLFEDLAQLNVKRLALELQSAILDHPYGDYMEVRLEAMPWQDAFDGTNVKLTPATMDQTVAVLHLNDKFDSERIDSHSGLRLVCVAGGQVYYMPSADEPKHFLSIAPRDAKIFAAHLLHKLFVISPDDKGDFAKGEVDHLQERSILYGDAVYRLVDMSATCLDVGNFIMISSAVPPRLYQIKFFVCVNSERTWDHEYDSVAAALKGEKHRLLGSNSERKRMLADTGFQMKLIDPLGSARQWLTLKNIGSVTRWTYNNDRLKLIPLRKA